MAHPRRPRCKYQGEMIQMDASSYEWIPGIIWHLHAAIDDASGHIVGLNFDVQETLKGYYNVFHQILTTHGIPAMFYTDRRTIFEYKRKKTVMDDVDTFTQFSYACHLFGVEIKTSSVAQAKGRVERLNKTLQSRLPVELARANITTIEDANQFLVSYIKKYNKQFALHLDSSKSVFEKQPDSKLINYTLSVLSNRTVDNGSSIKYNNSYYIPIDNQDNRVFLSKGTKVLIIKAFDKEIYLNHNDITYNVEKIPKRLLTSKEFDEGVKTPKTKKKPAPDHPWRRAHFNKHTSSLRHTNSSTCV